MQIWQDILPIGTMMQERYSVQGVLGNGGFGAVYLVTDRRVRDNTFNLFVLKEVINPNKHRLHEAVNESMSLRPLHHPALPRVYDVISHDKQDRVYVLMDYVEGWNLRILRLRLPQKAYAFLQAMTIMAPVMDAVTYLHSQRSPIIHQDIKPVNIIARKSDDGVRPGEVVLVDFGVDKKYTLDVTRTPLQLPLSHYVAPEQCNGEANPRSDIYGLGATFYTLLTDIVPPDAHSRRKRVESKGIDPLKPVNKVVPAVSSLVADSIHRAMSLSSDDRFSTVEEFGQALKADPTWQRASKLGLQYITRELELALNAAPVEPKTPEPVVEPPIASRLHALSEQAVPNLADEVRESAPERAVVGSTTTFVPEQPRTERSRKPRALLPLLALLLIGVSVGAVFLSYMVYHSRPATSTSIQLHNTPPQSGPGSTPISTSTPPSTAYPTVARSYSGRIHSISADVTTNMSLASIQQHQGNFSGFFTGLQVNGAFTGNIGVSRSMHFTLMDSSGHAAIAFDGAMQSDGNLAGTYCNLKQEGRCNGGFGIWSVAPAA